MTQNLPAAVTSAFSPLAGYIAGTRLGLAAKTKIDAALVRYDAWFLVFIAVLLALGATLLIGMGVWCVVNKKGKFTGSWKWVNYGIQVSLECKR